MWGVQGWKGALDDGHYLGESLHVTERSTHGFSDPRLEKIVREANHHQEEIRQKLNRSQVRCMRKAQTQTHACHSCFIHSESKLSRCFFLSSSSLSFKYPGGRNLEGVTVVQSALTTTAAALLSSRPSLSSCCKTRSSGRKAL